MSALEYLRACRVATVVEINHEEARGILYPNTLRLAQLTSRRDTLAEAIAAIGDEADPVEMLMTEDEHRLVSLLGEAANLYSRVIGNGASRVGDVGEMVGEIHHLQTRVLAQAAGRAFPERYRTLGGTVRR